MMITPVESPDIPIIVVQDLLRYTGAVGRLLSDGGAENWAIVASLIETCKINGVDPQAYMADVLTKIVDGQLASKLDVPWAYAQPVALKDVA